VSDSDFISSPAVADSRQPCENPSATIEKYLAEKFSEASAQFDITMHYVNQAIAVERERCAKIAETAYDATAEGRGWCDCIAAKIRGDE
jgi:hypothetical protein